MFPSKPVRQVASWLAIITVMFGGITAHAGDQTVGLFRHDLGSSQGYTLFAPMFSPVTYLIDNSGREVHRWTSSYAPFHSAYLLEDGNLLRTSRITPKAAGLELMAWDGTPLWEPDFQYLMSIAAQANASSWR